VDKAVTELISEGFLVTVKGGGTYINESAAICKSLNWAVILPNIRNEIYPEFLCGIDEFAVKNNINIVICNCDNNPVKQRQHIMRLIDSHIDGCIMIPSIASEDNFHCCQMLQNAGVPLVFCVRSVEGIDAPFVGTNTYYGAYLGTKRLIEAGCKRIAYVALQRYCSSIERYYGYLAALEDSGLTVDYNLVILENDKADRFKGKVEKLLSRPDPPDGILCFNDTTASVVYPVVAGFGLVIGWDISIVGYDNSRFAGVLSPPLTSVDYRADEVGKMAAEILQEMIVSGNTKSQIIKLIKPVLRENGSVRTASGGIRGRTFDKTQTEGEGNNGLWRPA
jgi:DNA-binding LacI/PurR family transcriptional regulator